mmetsp:Transcript_9124/g.17717  ORF Transcript_9124/g.17717 Transcript_9124/m.17717 type:complete len:301 (+) Transcript_9124:272-1174(+)|eukprot:CAMPEP_0173413868 /NCGR_PEP_ID=MMETSP1356-20130122/83057_1 /TAXON_ID=77927 ORGANISM="Hemiselmis virescens, Strain PCC157" /NCGR_SAMPLE_ID=MMETSP1356 /ASSEMBLY_ACC=CAM_ASM_000847 /LENGTH=300 /DNA_ID=CAMNT_0014375965 /DNA_START=202 /DNA_END=1104 /DNA_ORIENTATION=-
MAQDGAKMKLGTAGSDVGSSQRALDWAQVDAKKPLASLGGSPKNMDIAFSDRSRRPPPLGSTMVPVEVESVAVAGPMTRPPPSPTNALPPPTRAPSGGLGSCTSSGGFGSRTSSGGRPPSPSAGSGVRRTSSCAVPPSPTAALGVRRTSSSVPPPSPSAGLGVRTPSIDRKGPIKTSGSIREVSRASIDLASSAFRQKILTDNQGSFNRRKSSGLPSFSLSKQSSADFMGPLDAEALGEMYPAFAVIQNFQEEVNMCSTCGLVYYSSLQDEMVLHEKCHQRVIKTGSSSSFSGIRRLFRL